MEALLGIGIGAALLWYFAKTKQIEGPAVLPPSAAPVPAPVTDEIIPHIPPVFPEVLPPVEPDIVDYVSPPVMPVAVTPSPYVSVSELDLGPFLDRSLPDYSIESYLEMIPEEMTDPWRQNVIEAIDRSYRAGATASELLAFTKSTIKGFYRQFLTNKYGPYVSIPPQWDYAEEEMEPVMLALIGRDDTVLGRNIGITVHLYPGDQPPENARQIIFIPRLWLMDFSEQQITFLINQMTEDDLEFIRSLGIVI